MWGFSWTGVQAWGSAMGKGKRRVRSFLKEARRLKNEKIREHVLGKAMDEQGGRGAQR